MQYSAFIYTLARWRIITSNFSFTSPKSRYSLVMGSYRAVTCSPVSSSRPPLMAYSSALARFARAPKYCICLPTRMGDTQQAMA